MILAYIAITAVLVYGWGILGVVFDWRWDTKELGMAALVFWPVGLPVLLTVAASYYTLHAFAAVHDQAENLVYKLKAKKNV